MARYVAFLRAVNVGGRTVKMDELRALFTEVGLSEVESFIASGNVIFSTSAKATPALEQKIEARLLKALGYEVLVFVRTLTEVAAAAANEPFAAKHVAAAGAHVAAFLEESARRGWEEAPGGSDVPRKPLCGQRRRCPLVVHAQTERDQAHAREVRARGRLPGDDAGDDLTEEARGHALRVVSVA